MDMDYKIQILLIARRIKELRKQQGLTVQELAYRCDIERSNMSRIEAGRTNLTIKTMCLICNAHNSQRIGIRHLTVKHSISRRGNAAKKYAPPRRSIS